MYVCRPHVCMVPAEIRKDVRFFGTEVTGDCKPP